MAFFNDLVRAIAAIEGMEEMTVRGIGLSVRDAGHISKGGRGLSAAKMTIRDAANLLIGVNASPTTKDAGLIIERYREAVLTDQIGLRKEGSGKLFSATRLHQKFGLFLEAMIEEHLYEDSIDGKIVAMIDLKDPTSYQKAVASRGVKKLRTEIVFLRPEPEVDVDFVDPTNEQSCGQMWFMSRGYHSDRDRRDSTKITDRTVRAVAEALRN